ncbi:MAG: DUF4179 domain-containing protein [Sarcina sp.]
MKDIYELFNNINIDDNEFIEMETNELESIKLKKSLKKSINMRKNKKGKCALVASLAFITTLVLGVSFPTYAKQIPIIGNVFSILEDSIYKNYKESANELNITKESNGINITVNDAVFDGTNITLTYTIESDKDLGEDISLWSYMKLKDLDHSGSTIHDKFMKINDNTYVGQSNISIFDLFKNPKDSIDFTLNIRGIINDENEIKTKGRWEYNISLKAIEGDAILVNKSVENEGIIATIDRVTINPMSIFIAYSENVSNDVADKYDSAVMDLEVRDDLGNMYKVQGHGSEGDTEMNQLSSIIVEKLKDGAKKLIVTPKVILKDLDGVKYQEQQSKNGYNGETSIGLAETYDCLEVKEIILEDIIIELN